MLAATVDIVKTDGPGALLTGLGPTLVGYGVEGAMKFGVYEVAKPVMKALLTRNNDDSMAGFAYLFASILAGAVAALLLCPMESLRIKQVTDPSFAKDSIFTGLPKIIRQDGLLSLFGGVMAMLAKQVRFHIYYFLFVLGRSAHLCPCFCLTIAINEKTNENKRKNHKNIN